MINRRDDYSEHDYKYVAICDSIRLKKIFNIIANNINPNYSMVVLFKGNTYIISIFTLEDKSISYSIIKYKNIKSTDEQINSYKLFSSRIDELFGNELFIVLMDILYPNGETKYYPITTNEYLEDTITTRTDNLYLYNLPTKYSFKTTNKVFSLLLIFMLINLLAGIICMLNIVNYKDIIFSIVTLLSSFVSLIVLVTCYGFKTNLENGLISSSRLFKLHKTYKFTDIKYVEDRILNSLFSTRKTYFIHMKDNSIVKIKYFNSNSPIIDDELKELIVYLREMFISNKIPIRNREVTVKWYIIIAIIIYALSIIIF